ncbi:MAG: CRISPR-associated protein Cas4 [Cellulosilyticaceae bacterium]
MMPFIIAGVVILMLVTWCIRPTISVKHKVQRGQPFATMVYTDEKGGKLLVAESHGLQGKPDYIFRSAWTGRYIPFEIKSGKCKEDVPHPGDLMQLVAYFIIIEEVYESRPKMGKLVYSNKTFKVRNTRKLRRELIQTLKEMRGLLEGDLEVACEPSYIKCKNCVCQQTVCEWYGTNKR